MNYLTGFVIDLTKMWDESDWMRFEATGCRFKRLDAV